MQVSRYSVPCLLAALLQAAGPGVPAALGAEGGADAAAPVPSRYSAFEIVPPRQQQPFYPCMNCHQFKKTDPQPRELAAAPHAVQFEHGDGRMWCLNCHHAEDRNVLQDAMGRKVAYDEAPAVCATCHQARHEDWLHGAHGKRVANWRGERVLYGCTHCHDPHAPALAPRPPAPPPTLRAGLRAPAAEPAPNPGEQSR